MFRTRTISPSSNLRRPSWQRPRLRTSKWKSWRRQANIIECPSKPREALLQSDPGNPIIRRNLLMAYGNYASLLGIPWSPNLGRPEEARIYAAKAVAIARTMVAADVNNATGKHDLGMSLSRLGTIDPAPGTAADSFATFEEARKADRAYRRLEHGFCRDCKSDCQHHRA
jgi:hypothetical protein